MSKNTKPSGIGRIGNIPVGWEVKPAKYILESNQKVLNETTKADYFFRYIDISSVDFDKGIIGYEEINFENAPSRARRIVKKGDTIISTVRTYLRAIARIEDDKNVIVSTGFAVLSPKNNDPIFIEYYCKSDVFCSEIEKLSYGIAYPAINESVLINIKIILPPPEEQQAIATFLDTQCSRIDGIITEMEQQIEILKQYKTSLITETVTKGLDKSVPMKDSGIDWIGKIPAHWEVKKIRYLGNFQNGISKEGEYFGSGYPFVSYGDVYNNMQLPVEIDGKVESSKKERVLYSVKTGDVFFTRTSETIEEIGLICVCEQTIPDSTFAGFLIRFRPITEELDIHYSKFYLQADLLRIFFVKEMMIVTRASLPQSLLKNLWVLLPPIKEQKSIAAFLDTQCNRIDNLIAEKRQSIETMRAYKKSIIYEYVTGKKRIKGYS